MTNREVFVQTSLRSPHCHRPSGRLVNNLNDAWRGGCFPSCSPPPGCRWRGIGVLAALYPAVWGVASADHRRTVGPWGRKWLIVAGMWLQAVALALVATGDSFPPPGRWPRCCWAPALRWSTRPVGVLRGRCHTPPGGPGRLAPTGCGETADSPSAQCSRVFSRMPSDSTSPSG